MCDFCPFLLKLYSAPFPILALDAYLLCKLDKGQTQIFNLNIQLCGIFYKTPTFLKELYYFELSSLFWYFENGFLMEFFMNEKYLRVLISSNIVAWMAFPRPQSAIFSSEKGLESHLSDMSWLAIHRLHHVFSRGHLFSSFNKEMDGIFARKTDKVHVKWCITNSSRKNFIHLRK